MLFSRVLVAYVPHSSCLAEHPPLSDHPDATQRAMRDRLSASAPRIAIASVVDLGSVQNRLPPTVFLSRAQALPPPPRLSPPPLNRRSSPETFLGLNEVMAPARTKASARRQGKVARFRARGLAAPHVPHGTSRADPALQLRQRSRPVSS